MNERKLEKPEANEAYEDEEIIAIIANANSIIANALENIEQNSDSLFEIDKKGNSYDERPDFT